MKEIKFRVFNERKVMMPPFSLSDAIVNPFHSNRPLTNEMHVMQFTGLTDKNGKEIYEGDVVECDGLFAEVVFNDSAWSTCGIKADAERWDFFRKDKMIPFGDLKMHEWKVIGNIYENPELLSV